VISWSSAGHQLVNNCSSAAHQLLISWSSAAHQLLSAGHQLVSGRQLAFHLRAAISERKQTPTESGQALRASSSLHRPPPPAMSAFPSCLARFRLPNLHVLLASPASACYICISSSSPCALPPPAKPAFPFHVPCFRLLSPARSALPLRVLYFCLIPPAKSVFPLRVPCLRLLNLHFLSVCLASACFICISSQCALLPPAKSAFPLRVPSFCPLNLHFLSVCLASAC